MLQFPEIMKKAQAQLDEVVGRERLPDYSDEPNLPYITAIIKEMLRNRPVAPLGIIYRLVRTIALLTVFSPASAHYIKEDDIYEGYYIPKNSIVLGNSWAILRDPEIYGPDADEFKPERFLNADGTLNPNVMHPDAAFGFGRRICPGKTLAQHSLFMNISAILWAFTIETIPGKEPSGKYSTGLLSRPEPFECTVKPRHDAAPGLIQAALAQQT
jgi:cytochrome P450